MNYKELYYGLFNGISVLINFQPQTHDQILQSLKKLQIDSENAFINAEPPPLRLLSREQTQQRQG